MIKRTADVAIVGAGIVGLAHAYIAARSGRDVVVFERGPAATGASIRNFGMIWPIGQPPGPLHELALRSRELWLDVLRDARLSFRPTGSLHVTYRDDEADVGKEFAERGRSLGYECAWLSPLETLARTSAVRAEGLLGALWSPTELTVDPRQIVSRLPQFLSERFGVRFAFNTAVQHVESSALEAGGDRWTVEDIVVATGDDFQTLFHECFRDSGITRCKLQMMRTVPQPAGWTLGPSLAFGLTFNHYPTFRICESLTALKHRIERETPEIDTFGIHVMISQTDQGALTIGDSHEYGMVVDVFDKPAVNQLILDYARQYVRVPTLQIAETWHGVYAKHPDYPYVRFSPADGVCIVIVTTGVGMTMSFGIAEQTFKAARARL